LPALLQREEEEEEDEDMEEVETELFIGLPRKHT